MDLVSIIVPVYNSITYLEDTVRMLQKQTYRMIEIILVDDGATDGSSLVCDKLSQEDSRIKVVHQKNGGICAARNTGLKNAQGRYIMFCDDDDLYCDNTVEVAVGYIKKFNVNMVKYKVQYITLLGENEISRTAQGYKHCGIIDTNSLRFDTYFQIRENKSFVYIWNAIYERDIIANNHILFDEKYRYGGEDFDFNYQFLLKSNLVYFADEVLYTHYKRSNHSTSAKYDDNQIDSVYLNLNIELEFCKQMNDERVVLYTVMRHFWGLMSVMENTACKHHIQGMKQVYRDYYEKVISNRLLTPLYGFKLLKKCGMNIKRIIIMLLLKYKHFHTIALISYVYRKKESEK